MSHAPKRKTKKSTRSSGMSFTIKLLIVLIIASSAGFAVFSFVSAGGSTPPNEVVETLGNKVTEKSNSKMEEVVNVDTIYENIEINGIPVGGLTKDAALAKLQQEVGLDNEKVTFVYEEDRFEKLFSTFNANFNLSKAVDEAYSYARTGTIEERYEKIMALKKDGQKQAIALSYDYDAEAVENVVAEMGQKYYMEAKEPGFSRIDGAFSITNEVAGQSIDTETVIALTKSVLMGQKSGEVKITLKEVKPLHTAADYSKATDLMGTFTTNFAAGATNRNSNIKLAANGINNYVVLPGETFSTNKAFGSRTKANGYMEAGQFVNGVLEDGIGGGICQVSSTLYMALLHSELEIVARQNHSLKVGYMDWAMDATLSEGSIDLQFKNNTSYPVTIESVLGTKSITVNIYGCDTRDKNRRLVFENALVSSTAPAAEQITQDPSLPLNQRVVDVASKTGYKYELYKFVYINNVQTEKVLINASTYRPVRAQVRVGTGATVAETPTQAPVQEPVTPPATQAPAQHTQAPAVQTQAPVVEPPAQTENAASSLPIDEVPIIADGPVMP